MPTRIGEGTEAEMTITIDQILTEPEIERAAQLYSRLSGTNKFVPAIEAELIVPNLPRINKALGQENDARYLAYLVEYVFTVYKEHMLKKGQKG